MWRFLQGEYRGAKGRLIGDPGRARLRGDSTPTEEARPASSKNQRIRQA
jgi:hypothetical protein